MGILDFRYPLERTDEELAAGFEVREARTGTRAVDSEILLLLDNIELLESGLARVPQTEETGALLARVAQCMAFVKTWWRLGPSPEQRIAARREVLALRDALSNLQSRGKPRARLMTTARLALHQAAALALNAAGGRLPEEELRKHVQASHPVDAATWQAFLESERLLVCFSDGTVGLIPRDVPGGEKAMTAVQYEVVRRVRIARKPLLLQEIAGLLRFSGHPGGEWDLPLLRSVLGLESRLEVAGDSVTAPSTGPM